MTTYLAQANTGSDALTSTRTVTKPAGVDTGAVGVFWLVRWNEASDFPAVTPPSGAVLRGTITTASMQTQCYLHRVAAESSFAYSWTGARWSALAGLWFSGVDAALDLSTVPFQSVTGSGTAVSTLTVATDADSALAWHVNTIDTSGVSHTSPTGYTEVADVSPWAAAYSISLGSGDQDAAGATVSPTAGWAAGLVALPPAAASGTAGDAALTGTAALSAAGHRAAAGSAALTTAANLTGTGVRHAAGGAALTVTAHRTASGTRSTLADAGLAATVTWTADGVTGTPPVLGAATLNAAAALTAAGDRTVTAAAALHTTAGLAATGTTSVTGDDIDVTAGPPYSPWTAGYPHPSAWTVQTPHTSSWEVGAPC